MPLESRAARALGFANRHVHEQNPKPCDDHADTQEARKHQAASRRREVVPDQRTGATAIINSAAHFLSRRLRTPPSRFAARAGSTITRSGDSTRPRASKTSSRNEGTSATRVSQNRRASLSVSKIRHVAAPGDGKGFPFASVVPPLWTSLQNTTNWLGRTMSTQFAGRRSGS